MSDDYLVNRLIIIEEDIVALQAGGGGGGGGVTLEQVDDRVASLLVGGTNVTLTYNDAANTLTINATMSSHTHLASEITDFAEAVDDRVADLLVEGTNVTLTYNDATGTITIDAAGGGGGDLNVDGGAAATVFTTNLTIDGGGA
jgi:YD repeat-containing protein